MQCIRKSKTLTMQHTHRQPKAQGLYDPQNEHENCGIGLIVDMKGRKSHDIVQGALEICVNLDHRGGCGCDPITGDGAGIFIQLPHNFYTAVTKKESGFEVPNEGDYGVGFVFLSLHLMHGFNSAFQSIGANNKYTKSLKGFGKMYSIFIPVGFIFIAIFHHIFH